MTKKTKIRRTNDKTNCHWVDGLPNYIPKVTMYRRTAMSNVSQTVTHFNRNFTRSHSKYSGSDKHSEFEKTCVVVKGWFESGELESRNLLPWIWPKLGSWVIRHFPVIGWYAISPMSVDHLSEGQCICIAKDLPKKWDSWTMPSWVFNDELSMGIPWGYHAWIKQMSWNRN